MNSSAMRRRQLMLLFWPTFLLILLGIIVINFNSVRSLFSRAAGPPPIGETPVTKSVYLLIFNPIIESQGGVKLTTLKGWNDPDTLTSDVITALSQASNNYIHYTIAQRKEVDGIFVKPDDYQYSDDTYLACVNSTGPCHSPDIINYQKLFATYDLCNKNVDEIWLWGGPYFGYLEFNPVTYCDGKTKFVMGFSYERRLGEAIHDFGHRMEFVANKRVGNGNWQQNESNEWNKFSLIAGHCGNVHYPPGTIVPKDEYNYSKTTPVTTDCNVYLTYPTASFSPQSITCAAWNCSQEGYMRWWLGRIPHNPSTSLSLDSKTVYNNWWKYYAYFDETASSPPATTATPSTGDFTNLSATMPNPGSAIFSFTYTGTSNSFIVDASTVSDMSTDVYLNFAHGSSSPIVETNPMKWDKYSCGRTLYWRVHTQEGVQSSIQSIIVLCSLTATPTPTNCTGPNGSSCSTTICPVCVAGQPCPMMPCRIQPGTCQNGMCIPVSTPTPTPTQTCGNNGSICSIKICPTMPPCPAGRACPQVMPSCSVTNGTCQNGQCVPQKCYPRPRCLRGDEFPDCKYAGVASSLPVGATYCPPTPTPTPTQKPGDLNSDGKVNIFDYNILLANFDKTGKPGFIPADLNKDGIINIFDYNMILNYFE